MTTTTRMSTPAIGLALIALLALLLSLLGGTAAVATDDAPDKDTTCAPDDSDEDGDDGDVATADDCEDDDAHEFTDVPDNLPHVEGISWLSATGVTRGCKQGKFCPNKPVTRAEFATLAGRLLGEVDDTEPVAAPAGDLEALQVTVEQLEATIEDLEERLEALE